MVVDEEGLPPSKLGTKEHWDSVYQREVGVHAETGDEGEIWFGESSVRAMVRWCLKHHPPSAAASILDVGCGNGHLLLALEEEGYSASSLTGIDYSQAGIDLAKAVATDRGVEGVAYEAVDWLDPSSLSRAFDLILDKGTYDAISLMPTDEQGRRPATAYPALVAQRLAPGGHFLITSCNWTEQELRQAFEAAGLAFHSSVPKPSFSFGGQQGSTTSTCSFVKA